MPSDTHRASGTGMFRIRRDVRARIARVRMLILDVDGVLTDGSLYYAPDGTVTKQFNIHDGFGIAVARQAGALRFAVITGKNHPAVAARLADLGIDDYFPGFTDKRESYDAIRERYGLDDGEIAYLGDDWLDLPVMARAGVPLAVGNARPEVKKAAVYVTEAFGGHGAVREAVRLILHCQGKLDQVFDAWMKRHGL